MRAKRWTQEREGIEQNPVENKDGRQTETNYGSIQARNSDGSPAREKAIAQMCRERAVTDWLVYKWRSEFLDKAPGMFEGKLSSKESNASSARIAELERMVGQLSIANAL